MRNLTIFNQCIWLILFFLSNTHAQSAIDDVVLRSALKQAEGNLKKQLPVKVDEITTLENVTHAEKDLIFDYKIHRMYSLVQEKEFATSAKKMMTNHMCTTKMNEILKMGGAYNIRYKDASNKPFANLRIDRRNCDF